MKLVQSVFQRMNKQVNQSINDINTKDDCTIYNLTCEYDINNRRNIIKGHQIVKTEKENDLETKK